MHIIMNDREMEVTGWYLRTGGHPVTECMCVKLMIYNDREIIGMLEYFRSKEFMLHFFFDNVMWSLPGAYVSRHASAHSINSDYIVQFLYPLQTKRIHVIQRLPDPPKERQPVDWSKYGF